MKFAIIGAALFALVTTFAAESMQLGLQLWSLRNQITASLPQGMYDVKSLGFTENETEAGSGDRASETRALADANGLTIIGAQFSYEKMQTDLEGVIRRAHILGASYVIATWIPHDTDFTVEQAASAAASFNRWGARLKDAGLGFGFHTHGYEFKPLEDGSSAFDVIMKDTDPGLVFCEMDVTWVAKAGVDPIVLLKKYPGRFKGISHQ